jgi:hypothetical protein
MTAAAHRDVNGAARFAQLRLERWTRARVDGVLSELRALAAGRNPATLRAAVNLGTLAGAGLLERADAERFLLDACEANAWLRKVGERTARGVIARGLRYGIERGRLEPEIAQLAREASAPMRTATPRASRSRGERQRGEDPRSVAPPEPTYPPRDEVLALWASSSSVTADRDVAAYLATREIDPVAVHDRDLARALSPDARPRWASFNRADWYALGYRLILPLYDARGDLRSVVARDVAPLPGSDAPKSCAARGYQRRALVFACGLGRLVLASGAAPEWWAPGPPLRIIIREGEIDFLLSALRVSDANEHAPAVLGITAGSWTSSIAARVPDGAEIAIATDADEAGDGYALAIEDTLADRDVRIGRWKPTA